MFTKVPFLSQLPFFFFFPQLFLSRSTSLVDVNAINLSLNLYIGQMLYV